MPNEPSYLVCETTLGWHLENLFEQLVFESEGGLDKYIDSLESPDYSAKLHEIINKIKAYEFLTDDEYSMMVDLFTNIVGKFISRGAADV